MRLIDADKENERLLDFIAQNDAGIQYALEHKDMTMLEDIFFDYFEGQTIAYDVDKVVEQLEENAKYFQSEADGLAQVGNWGTATELQGKAAAYRDSAKTVKSGGIE